MKLGTVTLTLASGVQLTATADLDTVRWTAHPTTGKLLSLQWVTPDDAPGRIAYFDITQVAAVSVCQDTPSGRPGA